MPNNPIAFGGAMLTEENLKALFKWYGNYYIEEHHMVRSTTTGCSSDFLGWFCDIALDCNKALGPARPHNGWTEAKLREVGAWGVYRLREDNAKHPFFKSEKYDVKKHLKKATNTCNSTK